VRAASAGESARVEKRPLFGRRLAAEQRVAMRKAAETPDDVAMLDHVALVNAAERPDQLDGEILIREILRMLERHVHEDAQIERDLTVEPGRDGAAREAAREGIRREHVSRAAQCVARDL